VASSGANADVEFYPSLVDVVDAYQEQGRIRFPAVRFKYSAIRGRILEEYYGRRHRNAVTLLENKLKRRPPEYKLELEFESGSAHSLVDQFIRATRIEERRWNSVLSGRPLLILERWMFSLLVSILSFADYQEQNLSGEDLERRVKERVASAENELAAIALLAQRMARRQTLQRYLFGLPVGVAIVIGLGFIISVYRYTIADTVGNSEIMYSMTAGAVGAVISVMVRVSHNNNLDIDVDQGPRITPFVGAFRPIIGAIFGAVVVAFIHAGIVPFTPPADKDVTLFYCGMAFLAGFSERWAQDTILHSGQALKPAPGISELALQKSKSDGTD
jgi:hypothetical protein